MLKSLGFFDLYRYMSDDVIVTLEFIYIINKIALLPPPTVTTTNKFSHWAPLPSTELN